MRPQEVTIPPQSQEAFWCFNASVLVRKKGTNTLSYYLENDEDTLEVVFRERISADGNLYGCEMKPYTWEYSTVYPVLATAERKYEDPRIWLFKEKPFITFTHYPSLLFGEYSIYKKELSKIVCLPIGGNGKGALQKNWGFFQHEDRMCIVFLPSPLIILEMTYDDKGISLVNSTETEWDGQQNFRGGSSPVWMPSENLYYIFVHKTCDYNIWAICFFKDETDNKWKVKGYTKERLNTIKNAENEIHFVSGAIFDQQKQQWILSGGIRDNLCCFWVLPHQELLSKMTYLS